MTFPSPKMPKEQWKAASLQGKNGEEEEDKWRTENKKRNEKWRSKGASLGFCWVLRFEFM